MTDDDLDARMHARLTAAGERWRDENDDEPRTRLVEHAVGPERAASRRGRGLALIASAAVVAAALVGGGIVALSHLRGSDDTAAGGRANLVGTVWKLEGQGGSPATLYVSPRGYLVADDECTIIGAQVTTGSGRLDPGKIQVRHRDCTDQYGPRLGDAFAKTLASQPDYSAKRTTLTIGDQKFDAAPELPRPTIDVPTWEEAKWRLASARNASGKPMPLPADRDRALRVHDGVLTASNGCTGFSARAKRSGEQVTLGSYATNAIGCSALATMRPLASGSFRAVVRQEVLTISRSGVGTLVYRWVPEDPSAIDTTRLVGPTWRIAGIAGDAPAGNATLRFPSASTYEAYDGCRTFSGKATVSDGSVALQGIPRSPARDCAKSVRNQASTIDSFLAGGNWSIRDGKLLIDGGGSQAFSLVFVAKRSESTALLGRWTVVRVDPGSADGRSYHGPVSVTFTRTGFTIDGTCAQRLGSYTLRQSTLVVTGTGGRECADGGGVPAAASEVLWADGTAQWRFDDELLVLQRGRTILTLSPTR